MSGTDTPSAIVYLAKDFGGEGHPLPPGRYNLDYSTIAEDTISSIRVPEGWTVTVYRDRDWQGESAVYTADTADLGDFDDTVSSISVLDERPSIRALSGDTATLDATAEGQTLRPPPHVRNFDYSFTVGTTTVI